MPGSDQEMMERFAREMSLKDREIARLQLALKESVLKSEELIESAANHEMAWHSAEQKLKALEFEGADCCARREKAEKREKALEAVVERVRGNVDGHILHHQVPHRYCLACDILTALSQSKTGGV